MYESGSFHYPAKKVRKTLIYGLFWDFFTSSLRTDVPSKSRVIRSLRTDVKVPSKSREIRKKNFEEKKNNIFVAILKATEEKSRLRIRKSVVRWSGSVLKCHGIHNTGCGKHLFVGCSRCGDRWSAGGGNCRRTARSRRCWLSRRSFHTGSIWWSIHKFERLRPKRSLGLNPSIHKTAWHLVKCHPVS